MNRNDATYAAAVEANRARPESSPVPELGKGWTAGLLLLILAVVTVIRVHRLGVPLERDEGEYAYAAQLILDGVPPYSGAYNMKLPGIYVAYAMVVRVFGATPSGIHTGLLLVNLATLLATFALGCRLLGRFAGLCAAAAFGVLTLDRSVTGLFANSEHFVMLPVVLGVLALLRAKERTTLLPHALAGLAFGAAFVVKQHAIAFVLFGAVATWLGCRPRSGLGSAATAARIGVFCGAAALPFAATCAWLAAAGVFARFWFWTFTYAATYVSQVGFGDGLHNLALQLSNMSGPLLWLFAFAAHGLTAPLWTRATRPAAPWLLGFAGFAFLATCPGLLFRDHYFVLVLPACSLLAALGAVALATRLRLLGAGIAFAVATLLPLASDASYYFGLDDAQVSRATYGPNPFPEAVEIGAYLKAHATKDARIAVVGSEPQIYVYADRRAATGHIYTYALMEEHPFALDMQKEMIRQIETAKPEFVVYVNVPTSWLMRPSSHTEILKWVPGFLDAGYVQVGLLDIVAPDRTDRFWDADVVGKKPASARWLGVYRRKPA